LGGRLRPPDPAGVPLPKGKSNQVEEFPPGLAKIRCYLPGDSLNRYAVFEVVEGDSGHKSLDLECKLGAEPQIGAFMVGTAGSEYRDPVKEARGRFSRGGGFKLKEGDVVEEAGYPEDPSPPVRVVRNGMVIATIDFDMGTASSCE
jgi:hypothetical protein